MGGQHRQSQLDGGWVRFFLVENLWLLDLCEVVGGSDKGGILVRKGQDLKSEQCADRLGSKVCYPHNTTKKEGLIRLMEEIRLTR